MEKSDGGEASVASSTSTLHKKIRFPKEEESAKGEEGLQEYKQNPLDIPEIVAIVVGHLSEVGDLKSIRTQSRAWRDETLSKWRDSAVFLINDETIPILVKAFKDDLADLSEEDKAAALAERDPYRLREVPFKRYRFANERGGQPWTYPLNKDDVDGNLTWEKALGPAATFLDVGECSLKACNVRFPGEFRQHYLHGLIWILKRCPNLSEFAMAPFKSTENVEDLSESEDEEQVELLEGEDGYAERLRQKLREKFNRFKNPLWKLERLKAPQIQTLTISTPKQIWKKYSKNGKRLEYLFNDSSFNSGQEEDCFYVGQYIIGGMVNLKKLRLPSGGGATSLIMGFNESVNKKKIKLESLTAFASERKDYLQPSELCVYLKVAHPPIRELYMSGSWQSFNRGYTGIYPILSSLAGTLEKLELEVNCEQEEDSTSLFRSKTKKILKPDFSLWGSSCKKMTHFKISLDYETFPGDLGTYDLNRLRLLPKLEEFHFGMKDKVEEVWVTRKLNFVEDGRNPVVELTDLTSLHFHGNFTKESLRRLGGIMENLETLEVVLDEENCNVVGEVWPHLKNLKLLEGSDVPDEFLSNLKKSNPSLQRLEYL